MADSRLLTPKQIEEVRESVRTGTPPTEELLRRDAELGRAAEAMDNLPLAGTHGSTILALTQAMVVTATQGGVTRSDLLEYVGEWFDEESQQIN